VQVVPRIQVTVYLYPAGARSAVYHQTNFPVRFTCR